MAHSKWRGHFVECVDVEENIWIFSDTKEPVAGSNRPCGICDNERTPEGHDACLGNLPDVVNACCGHGEVEEAYIQYANDRYVHGSDAVEEFRRLTQPEE